MTTLERFYRFVEEGPNGCWLWTGAVDKDGYGRFWWKGRTRRVTHFVFEVLKEPLSNGLQACHHCDVRRCVAPEHLYAGTQQDNVRDTWRRGRCSVNARPQRGEANGLAKLTEAQVEEIRTRYRAGQAGVASGTSLRGLAKKFGVSKFTIQSVVHHVTWRHV